MLHFTGTTCLRSDNLCDWVLFHYFYIKFLQI
jgi:hypothetical protein